MTKAWTCPDCGRLNDYYPYPTRCSRCGYLHTPEAVPEVTIAHRGTEPEGIAIGDELGVRYEGIQVGYEELPTTMMFTDIYQTGSSFTGKTLEEATEKLSKTREAFAKPPAVSVVDYDRRYTLEELREMARQAGLSPSGSKKEIATRLIAKGVT